MTKKHLPEQQVKAICDILADTDRGLTKSEIGTILGQCRIQVQNDGSSSNGLYYNIGLNKRNWLYNCLAEDFNKSQSCDKIFAFIQEALNPIRYTVESKRAKYEYLLNETNKVLILIGMQISREGKLNEVTAARSLDEADRRVDMLRRKLYERSIHPEVQRFCVTDYLRKDYFDAVFEASKSLGNRVRELTGLEYDGSALFQKAFARNDPYLFMNSMKTDSEINEFNGLRELLECIYHLVRNPAAHTPKINWRIDETKALDVLTVISLAHKYLDECYPIASTGT